MPCREWPRAAHLHTRTGPQRAPGRRVLLADRPWLIADLRAWRHRQSRAWRLLRDRRLSCGDAGGPDRVRRRARHFTDCGRGDRYRRRAAVVSSLLSLRPDLEPAVDLRTCDGDRAGPAHRVRCDAPSVLDPARAARPDFYRDRKSTRL